MRTLKRFAGVAGNVLVVIGVMGMVARPTTYGQSVEAQAEHLSSGEGAEHRADPCELLPEAAGRALGHDKHCPPLGSSGGVARGDFNGDGFADLAVGVPLEDSGRIADTGVVNVIYGSSAGLVATGTSVPAAQVWHQDVLSLLGTSQAGDRFGAALASGDFNGDGFADLAVAVPGERNAAGSRVGGIHVLFGSSVGLTGTNDQLLLASSLGTVFPSDALSMVWADFNGDGFGDLAVEARGAQNSPLILIIRGSSSGLSSSATQLLTLPPCEVGSCGEVYLVDLVLAARDFNGDGFAELVVGAPLGVGGTAQNAGNVRILSGTVNGVTLTGAQLLHQNVTGVAEVAEGGDDFGAALAVGDFDGDTFPDLAVGAPGEDNGIRFLEGGGVVDQNSIANGGVVHLFLTAAGPQIVFEAQWATLEGGPRAFGDADVESADRNGSALAAGDFNDDGFADLAIGGPGETLGAAAAAGSVSVLYGSANGFAVNSFASADRQFWTESSFGASPASGDNFGAVLSAWNFGRNHSVVLRGPVRTADLAIGIPRKDVAGITDAGAVRVIYGFTSGLATSTQAYEPGPLSTPRPGPSQLWHQDVAGVPDQNETNDRFGSALY